MKEKTFPEVMDKLKRETEVDLLEILDLSSEELVDLLQDTIEAQWERIQRYYENDLQVDGEEESNEPC